MSPTFLVFTAEFCVGFALHEIRKAKAHEDITSLNGFIVWSVEYGNLTDGVFGFVLCKSEIKKVFEGRLWQ